MVPTERTGSCLSALNSAMRFNKFPEQWKLSGTKTHCKSHGMIAVERILFKWKNLIKDYASVAYDHYCALPRSMRSDVSG